MTERFAMIPAGGGMMIFTLVLAAILLGVLGLFAGIVRAGRSTTYVVSPAGLKIESFLYGRAVPATRIDTEGVRAVDLSQERDLQLRLRTNGVGMPGYSAGWFRLRNGEKCLAFVTDRRRVLYVPTKEDFSLLLSVDDPAAMRDALRRMTGR